MLQHYVSTFCYQTRHYSVSLISVRKALSSKLRILSGPLTELESCGLICHVIIFINYHGFKPLVSLIYAIWHSSCFYTMEFKATGCMFTVETGRWQCISYSGELQILPWQFKKYNIWQTFKSKGSTFQTLDLSILSCHHDNTNENKHWIKRYTLLNTLYILYD